MTGYSGAVRLSHNAGMLLVGSLFRMACTFGFVVFAARYLGVAGYGKFALTQYYFELSISLTATGLGILVTREVAKNAGWLTGHLAATVTLTIVLSLGAAGILFVSTHFTHYAPDTQQAIGVATVAIIPAALCALAEAIFIAFGQADAVALGVALESLVRTALCVTALLLGAGLFTLFIILIVTRSAQLCLYWRLLARRLPPIQWRLQRHTLWELAREWRVFAAETWVATLYLNLDVILLSLFYGEAAVGVYDAAWKLIRFGPVIANSLTTAVFPYIARLYVHSRESFQQLSEQSVKYILVAVLPAVLCISILAQRIVLLLFSQQYVDSTPILRVLAWLLIPQFLNPFLSRVLYARGHQRQCLAVGVIALLTFLALAFVLIPKYAALGTAWTTVCSSYVALGCYILFSTAGTDRRCLVGILVRQSAAAAVLCLTLLLLKDTQVVALLAAGAALYASLLIALRIVTAHDFKLLQELR
jgi:O-antigen/teichoic acid export membrane protein